MMIPSYFEVVHKKENATGKGTTKCSLESKKEQTLSAVACAMMENEMAF